MRTPTPLSIDRPDARVTAGLTPVFPVISPFADHIVVLMNFDVETAPLAFTLGAPAPGNVVGELLGAYERPRVGLHVEPRLVVQRRREVHDGER